jgi:hypothetical protein
MKPTISLALITLGLTLCPSASAFWWSLTDEEQQICESRAAGKLNEFSAKQAYERCKKSIRGEIKEREEREARREAEKAAAEAARERARKELPAGIKKRCAAYLPELKKLRSEKRENYNKYLAEREIFDSKMKNLYGPGYKRLGTDSSYPDYVYDQFPWIKWYREYLKDMDEVFKKISGGKIIDPIFAYKLEKHGCTEEMVKKITEDVVEQME